MSAGRILIFHRKRELFRSGEVSQLCADRDRRGFVISKQNEPRVVPGTERAAVPNHVREPHCATIATVFAGVVRELNRKARSTHPCCRQRLKLWSHVIGRVRVTRGYVRPRVNTEKVQIELLGVRGKLGHGDVVKLQRGPEPEVQPSIQVGQVDSSPRTEPLDAPPDTMGLILHEDDADPSLFGNFELPEERCTR